MTKHSNAIAAIFGGLAGAVTASAINLALATGVFHSKIQPFDHATYDDVKDVIVDEVLEQSDDTFGLD